MVERLLRVLFAAAVFGALPVACSLYSPSFQDCAVACGPEGQCPANTTCNDTFCRPEGFKGACTCEPGAQEACGGGIGECKPGLRLCLDTRRWGPCLGEVKATQEVCDGKDNDCDGTIDEDPYDAPPCPLEKGVCSGIVQLCVDAGYPGTCDQAAYGGSYEATERTCDMLDNDCDGVTDARQSVRLTTLVDKWAAAAVQDGFVLFTSELGNTQITAQFYDLDLRPVGTAEKIDVGVTDIRSLKAAGWGDKAVVGWTRNDNILGIHQWQRGQPVERLNTTLPGTTPDWSVAMTSDAGAVAAFAVDAGIWVHRWLLPGAPTESRWLPLAENSSRTSGVQLANGGRVLAWDGEYDDGGTTEYYGGVEKLDGTRSQPFDSFSDGVLVETPLGVLQHIDAYSTFIFIFIQIDESSIGMVYDVWQDRAQASTVVQANDHLRYSDEAATVVGNDVVVGWLDYNYLTIATSLPVVRQVRMRPIYVDGGTVAEYSLVGPQGAGLLAVLYRPQSDPASVYALMMCPP